jgi:hypothetical protein
MEHPDQLQGVGLLVVVEGDIEQSLIPVELEEQAVEAPMRQDPQILEEEVLVNKLMFHHLHMQVVPESSSSDT